MPSVVILKIKLSDILDQVFFQLRQKFLDIYKEELERFLEDLRDQIIRTRRYQRGNILKRWGFTIRKWLETPIGVLEFVRVPRIRDYCREVRLFMDQHVKRSSLINALVIEMFTWGLSTRRLSALSKKLFQVGLSAMTVSRLQRMVSDEIKKWRERPIGPEIRILIVDGVHGRYRGRKRGVCLLAIGVDDQGKAHVLDWLGASSEGARWYRRLFRRLKQRGLQHLEVLVSDDGSGIVSAAQDVWPEGFSHQLCLWHFSHEIEQCLVKRSWLHIRRFLRDYWEIFDALEMDEALTRWEAFVQKWSAQEPQAVKHMQRKRQKLLVYLGYPHTWRHRIRTVNLAEGFFSRLQRMLCRYPGWVNEDHIGFVVGLFLLGSQVFHHNQLNFYQQTIPENILTLNFNRMC